MESKIVLDEEKESFDYFAFSLRMKRGVNILEVLQNQLMNQGDLAFRLILACILGGIIGFERKNRNKGAGMRTHALVCLGAALIMVVSKYGFGDLPDVSKFDGSRIASQVVSGVGFLGAGIIFVRNNSISGVTTAAGIWVTSGVGLCVGAGQYFLSIIATILIITIQFLLHNIGFLAREPYRAGLKIVISNQAGIIEDIEEILKRERIEISILKINKAKNEDTKLDMEVVYPAGYNKIQLINRLSSQDCVISIRG